MRGGRSLYDVWLGFFIIMISFSMALVFYTQPHSCLLVMFLL